MLSIPRVSFVAVCALMLSLLAVDTASAAKTATITASLNGNNRQINAGPGSNLTATVTNTGDETLAITGAQLIGTDADQFAIATNNCAARGAGDPLQPSTAATALKTCTVIVTFNPTSTGAKSAQLEVATDGGPTVTTALSGTGRNLSVSQSSHDFGVIAVGADADKIFTITNNAADSYTLGAVSLTPNAARYTKVVDTCSGVALAQSATCVVGLRFNPDRPGAFPTNVAIASYGPNRIAISAIAGQPAVGLSPVAVDFGGVLPDASSDTKTVTVTNTGSYAFTAGTAEISGPGAGAFAIAADACSGQTVATGASCDISVVLTPGASGWTTATLSLPTLEAGTHNARLSGYGRGDGTDADPFGSLNLADQPTARIQGDGEDAAGAALQQGGACDVDNDGYNDVIIGSSRWSVNPVEQSWEGAAYVRFGGRDFGTSDLAAHGDGSTLLIQGEQEGAQTGLSVACAGDVNGDGFDDVIVGAWAYQYDDGRPAGTAGSRGRAYVVFGAADLREQSPLDLGNLGSRGFKIVSPPHTTENPDTGYYKNIGYDVTGLGDLDGDGKDEFGVMANIAPGKFWVIKGQSSTGDVDVSDWSKVLMRIDYTATGQLGHFAALEDFTGDGIPDISVGVYTAVYAGRSTASGYGAVIDGSSRGVIDASVPAQVHTSVGGAFAGHRLGIGIASAGDVNNDGLTDVIFAADSTSAANSDAAYVIYGRQSRSDTVLDTADLGTAGYRILGAPGSQVYAVSGAGDVNRDGNDDVLVGAYSEDGSAGSAVGAAYLVHGVADPTTLPQNDGSQGLVPANANDHTRTLSLSTLTPQQGSRAEGQNSQERFSRSLAFVGDVNGDGADDVAIGSDQAFRRVRSTAGEVAVVLLPAAATPLEQRIPLPTTPTDNGTGNGGDTPAPETPAQPLPPSFALASRKPRVDSKGRLSLTARCTSTQTACSGTLTLKFTTKSLKQTKIKAVKLSLKAGASKKLTIKLPAKVRKLLKSRSRLDATASVRLTSGSGTLTKTLKLSVLATKSKAKRS